MPRKIRRDLGDHDDYNYFNLMKQSREDLEAEYSRMRTQAKRQVTAIKNSSFRDVKIAQNKEYLERDPSTMSKPELAHYLGSTETFLSSKLSTVTGLRKQRQLSIERLHDRGYTFINPRNYAAFGQLMDDMRAFVNNNIITSDRIVDIVDNLVTKRNIKSLDKITQVIQFAIENNISLANVQKNFSFYWDNADELADIGLNPDRKKPYTRLELEKKLRG